MTRSTRICRSFCFRLKRNKLVIKGAEQRVDIYLISQAFFITPLINSSLELQFVHVFILQLTTRTVAH